MAKRKINKFKLIKFIVFVVLAVYAGGTLVMQQVDLSHTNAKLSAINAEIEYQMQIKDKLDNQLSIVNTSEYIEKVARDELNYAAPDEIIFMVVSQR